MRGGVVVVLGALAGVAHAESALEKPAFTATPSELLAAAKTPPAGTTDVFVLREDNEIAFDDRGRITTHWHMIFVVASRAGADDWSTLGTSWLPGYQDKPTMRARVIDPSGAVAELDQKRITDAPASTTTAMADGRRRLEATLPTLQVGSVVEEEIDSTDRDPLVGGGAVETYLLNGSVPVVSARVTISAPAKRKPHIVARNIAAKPRVETRDGRQRIVYAAGPLAPMEDRESALPPDAAVGVYLRASLAESWRAVARDYRAVIDKRIAEGPVAFPADLPKTASVEAVTAIVGWLHRTVRTDDLSFSEASVIPSTPAETVKRGIGDSKDKATLLVSLLRQAGIAADVALFEDGPGVDIDREAIGLNVFDDVLVRAQVGGKELWIDPTSSAARPGQLPWVDQGRLALVVADSTTGLVSTPAASAGDNTSRETRTYELAEMGAAKVSEVVRASGALEVGERAWFRDLAPDKARKDLADYVSSQYNDAKLDQYSISDPNDLTKPFQMTLVATGARRAYTERLRADVYLFPSDVLSDLPDEISHPPDKARVRKFDLVFPSPHVTEIENRIIIPPGFTVPTPAPDKTRDLGTMKVVEQQRVDGQTFIITFRLDTGKTRISPGDVTRVQEAIRAFRKEGSLHVVIEQTAKALAAHGKYPEAIAELQRLIKLHPKEALHHSQLATILIDIGAGEAARREARKGTEVEPQSADAFVVYGWTLGHDTFGHPGGFDHDRAGAIAAYEKARKLNPKHTGAAIELARLLERSPQGRLYDTGSDVKRAIDMWRAAREIDDTTETSFALIRALLWTGDGAGAEAIARSMEQGETRDSLLVAAVAIGKGGPAAAIRTADSLGSGAARTKILQLAMVALMYDRQYDAMRSLAAELSLGSSPYTAVIQNLKRQAPGKRSASAEDVAVDVLMAVSTTPASITSSPLFADKHVAEEINKSTNKVLAKVPSMSSMNAAVVEDLIRSSAHVTSQTEGPVTRVEIDSVGAKTAIYLVSQKSGARVIGATDAVQGIGRYLLTVLAKNDEKTPARVLDWVAADVAGARGPMMILSRVWGTNLPRTKQAMELAAAVLTTDTDTTRTIPIFKRCGATTTDGQFVCDAMLADAYIRTQNWSELDDHTRAWIGRAKQTAFPMTLRAHALARLGKFDEADQVVADALAAFPDEHLVIHSHMEVAFAKRAYALAVQRSEPLAKRSDATAQDLNNVAWARLLDGSDLPNAHLIARKAIQLDGDAHNILNTIAAIEAETKEVADAKDNLDKSMRGSEDDPPEGGDWYVHGRILEQLGLADDAIVAYRKVTSKHLSLVPDSDELAARRLKALGATTKK